MAAFHPLRTQLRGVTLHAVSKALAVAGLLAVMVITAVMLATADNYLWDYPSWAWILIWTAALGLAVNAVLRPELALSIPAIMISIALGIALAWPVSVGGNSWRPAWLTLGITMPLLGCWLLGSFSTVFRRKRISQ